MDKTEFIAWVTKLQATYNPNDSVRQKINRLTLVAFVGPTGVGKTTLMRSSGIPYVRSDVTRDPRPNEKDGREYNFRKDYLDILQEIKQGLFAQFVINSNGEFYGTKDSSYPDSGMCSMAIIAKAIPFFRDLGFANIIPLYILPPSYVEWMRRIGGVRSADLQARFTEARESLPSAIQDSAYHFILNDQVESAIADIQAIISGQAISEHRDSLARQTAELLIGRLGNDE